jgi:acetyl-CoA C-acetyltransferase
MVKQSIYLVDGVRTIVGSPYKSLKEFTDSGLAAFTISDLLKRNKDLGKCVDEVILGNAVLAGTGQNFARQAALLAHLPESTRSFSVNNVCGSSLQSVLLAMQSIQSLNANVVIAGGAESATHCPYLVLRHDVETSGKKECFDSLINDGLFCRLTGKTMGQLVEALAKKHKISREEQDLFALNSHQKAILAQTSGAFDKEIVKIKTSRGKLLEKDDRPRKNIKIVSLQGLPSAFLKGGTVTAGNSSIPCDGAASVVLASQGALKNFKHKPLAKIVGFSSIAIAPKLTFEASNSAIKDVLKKCGLEAKDVDLYEVSESFAAQAVLTKKKLHISSDQLNIHGGDIALGHPLGAAGARGLVTLLHSLVATKKKRGCVSISYGGGGAIAIIVERCS